MERDHGSNRATPETRERAVRMMFETLGSHPDRATAIWAVAPKIGCGRVSLRREAQAETDSGAPEGVTSEKPARKEPLRTIGPRNDGAREVREPRRADEIPTGEDRDDVLPGEGRDHSPPSPIVARTGGAIAGGSEDNTRTPVSPRRRSFAGGSSH